MDKPVFYTIDYATAGTFDLCPKMAENCTKISEGQEWRGDARLRFSAIKYQGKLYITNEIVTVLGCHQCFSTDAKIGRAYLYDFEKHFDEIVKRQEYPERTEREKFVTRRNNRIIELLVSIL